MDEWDGCQDEGFYMDPSFDDEPYMSFQEEFDSSMTSAGWGTDEDYGFYGDDYAE